MPPIKIFGDQENLVETKNFPYAKFPFEKFNPVQSRVFEFYDQNCNVVIAAATSAGKTVMGEMLLSHEIRKRGGKGMYLAPLKALAQEKIDDWTNPNHHFGDLDLSICTGDYRLTKDRKKELENSSLVLMTTEMLSARCRNFKSEHNNWLTEVGTVVVDESHLLTVPGRGDHLEIGLMKLTKIAPHCRIVLLSATMPNVSEIANWVSYDLTRRDTYLVESEYRPCPLTVHYEKCWDGAGNYEDNELEKVRHAIQIIEDYPDDKFLVFAHTKRTGNLFKQHLKRMGEECEFHNADLDKDKRISLETRFKNDPKLRVVAATSTLAWGCHSANSKVAMADGTLKFAKNVKEGEFLPSFDGKKFVTQKVLKTGRFKSKGYRIQLESGEVCNVSENHEFYGMANNKAPNWINVNLFQEGDFIAVPKTLICCENEEYKFDKLSYLVGLKDAEKNLEHLPEALVKDRPKLISYLFGLIGDFLAGEGTVSLPKANEDFLRKIQHCLLTFGVRVDFDKDKKTISRSCEDSESDILFRKITKIERSNDEKIYIKIAVSATKNYVADGVVSHNCNLPARRVILLGMHRGLSPVDNYDVYQMMGRAGRPAYDPSGDAYLLLPQSHFDEWKIRLSKPQLIKSQLLEQVNDHYKVLAFHLVSEIHHKEICTPHDLKKWYKRTLAHHQNQDLDDGILEKTLELLVKRGVIYEEDGEFHATKMGIIASMFYYSPFDIADLKSNFNRLFSNGMENNDYAVSVALGNIDTYKGGIVSKAERAEMGSYSSMISSLWPSAYEPGVKAGFAYYMLMHGSNNPVLSGVMRNIQFDSERVIQVLHAIDSMNSRWDKKQFLSTLGLRIKYGVKGDRVHLCRIPNIGKVRADKLWRANIRTFEQVASNPNKVQLILKMKEDKVREICRIARDFSSLE